MIYDMITDRHMPTYRLSQWQSIRNAAACSQTRSQPKRHCKSSTQQVSSTLSISCDSAIGLHLLRNPICAQNY